MARRPLTFHPIADWLLEAHDVRGPEPLVEQLALRLTEAGVPLWRLSATIETAHPELAVQNITWVRGAPVQQELRDYATTTGPDYAESPVRVARETGQAVRRRLTDPSLEFPSLRRLAAQGATDYVVHALMAFHERRNWISLATDAPAGFTDEQLSLWEGLLPFLSQRLELSSVRFAIDSLLSVYLGRSAASRVVRGDFRRGTGQLLPAAIWYCDLRGFTSLVDGANVSEVVKILDRYFECTAGSVERHGGEVLKFVGDAVLALFPIAGQSITAACEKALAAACEAQDALERWNLVRCGIALHVGEVMFGNIGSATRLDFTPIGACVNEVARIESLTKELGAAVLMSRGFANAAGAEVVSLGRHPLKGVSEPPEVLTLARFAPPSPRES